MVMTLTEGEPPLPPRDGTFTDEFITFLSQCIALEPEARASAMDLLRSDWCGGGEAPVGRRTSGLLQLPPASQVCRARHRQP